MSALAELEADDAAQRVLAEAERQAEQLQRVHEDLAAARHRQARLLTYAFTLPTVIRPTRPADCSALRMDDNDTRVGYLLARYLLAECPHIWPRAVLADHAEGCKSGSKLAALCRRRGLTWRGPSL